MAPAGGSALGRFDPVTATLYVVAPQNPLVFAVVGSLHLLVYDGTTFTPFFAEHSTATDNGGNWTFGIVPNGGWWRSNVQIFYAAAQAATTLSMSPADGSVLNADPDIARITPIGAELAMGAGDVPLVFATIGSWAWTVFNGAAAVPLFSVRSTSVNNGDGTWSLSLIPNTGWWRSGISLLYASGVVLASPSYTVANDVVEDLVTAYRGVVPADLGNPNRADNLDDVYALAEMMAIAECVARNWVRMALVSTSSGPYLELLARGAGLHKQSGETDDQLRARIQTPPLALTPDMILSALYATANTSAVYLVELPRDAGYAGAGANGHGLHRPFASRGRRIGARGQRVVLALVPASAAAKSACTDTLRAKVTAGAIYRVEEYTES